NNTYDCRGSPLKHNGAQLTLSATGGDKTVYVACGGDGFLLHCTRGSTFTFDEPKCAGAVDVVQNVKEHWQ
ncbi:hypothetical protein E4U41_005012, partial [Claviceps citrina]